DVLKASLDVAAGATTDPEAKKRMQIAAASAPTALKSFAIGMQLGKKIEEGDADGVVDCLSKAGKAALNTIQGIKKIEATAGKPEKAAKEAGAKIDKETLALT